MAKASKKGPRSCQPCTACCDGWVRIEIEGRPVYPGNPCLHSTGSGCRIYKGRPEQCRRFECGWIQEDSPLPDWMKPSDARVMVLPGVRTWHGAAVDAALPVGKRIPPRALNWLQAFARRNGRPLIYMSREAEGGLPSPQSEVFAYGPPEFQQEIAGLVRAGVALW